MEQYLELREKKKIVGWKALHNEKLHNIALQLTLLA
jgi:hypothetical protein